MCSGIAKEIRVKESRFVIAGGGMVAGYAAKELVSLGLKPGELTILSSDNSVPYERPPLSKGFLAGRDAEDTLRINTQEFYRDNGIDLQLNCEVSSLDADRKRLTVKSGGELGFEELIIATGARPRTLNIPGANLRNVLYLRSLDDSKAIQLVATTARHAVVIGGGFIGMEVAAVLAQKKIDVTMILHDDRVGARIFSPRASTSFEAYYAARGVRFIRKASLREFRGDGSVQSVVLANGEPIACDLVVAGIGVQPATDMLQNSGLQIGDGVIVNEYLETSRSGIYAAGDVANYPDVIFGKRRRVEHWDNAVSQGQHCARALMGKPDVFRHVPYFFSDVFDLSYEYWGDSSEATQVFHRGDFSSTSFSVWWLRENRLMAAFVMNRPDEERENAPKWIESGQRVSGPKLEDVSRSVLSAIE